MRRKARGFPHPACEGGQSRLFRDFEATLLVLERLVQQAGLFHSQSPFLQGLVCWLTTDGQGAIAACLERALYDFPVLVECSSTTLRQPADGEGVFSTEGLLDCDVPCLLQLAQMH